MPESASTGEKTAAAIAASLLAGTAAAGGTSAAMSRGAGSATQPPKQIAATNVAEKKILESGIPEAADLGIPVLRSDARRVQGDRPSKIEQIAQRQASATEFGTKKTLEDQLEARKEAIRLQLQESGLTAQSSEELTGRIAQSLSDAQAQRQQAAVDLKKQIAERMAGVEIKPQKLIDTVKSIRGSYESTGKETSSEFITKLKKVERDILDRFRTNLQASDYKNVKIEADAGPYSITRPFSDADLDANGKLKPGIEVVDYLFDKGRQRPQTVRESGFSSGGGYEPKVPAVETELIGPYGVKRKVKPYDIREIENLRMMIGDAIKDKAASTPTAMEQKVINQMYGALSQDIRNAIESNLGAESAVKWSKANNFLNKEITEQKKTVLGRALDKSELTPEVVSDVLSSSKPSDVRRIYNRLTPEGKAAAEMAVLKKVYDRSLDLKTQELNPNKFIKEYDKQSTNRRYWICW
jgi:hypothetical protein